MSRPYAPVFITAALCLFSGWEAHHHWGRPLSDARPPDSAATAAHSAAAVSTAAANATATKLFQQTFHPAPNSPTLSTDPIAFAQTLSGCDAETLRGMLDGLHKDWVNGWSSAKGSLYGQLLLSQLYKLDPQAAVDSFTNLASTTCENERSAVKFLFTTLASSNLEQAQELIARLPMENETQRIAALAVLMVKAKSDPVGALSDFLSPKLMEEQRDPGGELWTLLEQAAQHSPEQAMKTVLQTNHSRFQTSLISEVCHTWLRENPQEMAVWAVKNPEITALQVLLAEAPRAADLGRIREIFPTLPYSPAKADLAGTIARRYAETDLDAALTWATSLKGTCQQAAHEQLCAAWIDKDPVAASAWLATWPSSQGKNEAAGWLVQ